jgi:antitoxin component of RelBE/YafQ-DinJ toxin-antitoxin module
MPPDAPAAAPTSAPAPAAAPSGGSPAPAGGGAAAAPAAPAASSGSQSKLPWGEGPLRVPTRFNDKEETVEFESMEDLQRAVQQSRLVGTIGKQHKEALAKLKAAEEEKARWAEALKQNPFAHLAAQGLDVDEIIKTRILENARRSKLPPEQLAQEDAERRIAEMREKELAPLQKKLKEMETAQKQAALQTYAEQEWARLEPQFLEVAKARGIDIDEDVMASIADVAATWLDAGVELNPAQILESVVAADEKRFWGRLNKQKAEALYKRLPKEMKQQLVQMAVKEWRDSQSPTRRQAGAEAPAPPAEEPKKPRYIDEREFKRSIGGR